MGSGSVRALIAWPATEGCGFGSDYVVMELLASLRGRAQNRFALVRVVDARLLVGVTFCLLLVQWTHAVSGFGGATVADFFGRWMYLVIEAVAAAALLWRGLSGRRARGAWLILGLGLFSKAVGDAIYSLAGNLATVPVPSVSDLFWLGFYPCAYVALLLLVRDRIRTTLAATRLDGVICGVTVASLLACVTLPTAFANALAPRFGRSDRSGLPGRRSRSDGRSRERSGVVGLAR